MAELTKSLVVSLETRHPTLLLREQWVSLLIMRHVHQYGHSRVAATVAKTRKKMQSSEPTGQTNEVSMRSFSWIGGHSWISRHGRVTRIPLAPLTSQFCYTVCDFFGPKHVKLVATRLPSTMVSYSRAWIREQCTLRLHWTVLLRNLFNCYEDSSPGEAKDNQAWW